MMWLLKCTKHLLLISIVGGLSACTDTPSVSVQDSSYFSMSSYIDREIARLSARSHTLIKAGELSKNIATDTLLIAAGDSLFWKRELSIFSDTDISKAGMRDKYQVDSIISIDPTSGLENLQLRFTAYDNQPPIRSLDIHWQNDSIVRIVILTRADNAIYESDKQLTYIPDDRYNIQATQEVIGGSIESFSIETRWVYP